MRIIIVIIIIITMMIHLNLLGIEFHFFFMYDISDLITRITGLKSLFDLSFSFNFCLIIFSRFYCSILVF